MDSTHINRLKDEQQKGLRLCEENILQWEKFKVDYEMLKQQLEILPDALSYDITVPFGSQAFTKGKLVHTNEVMVLLGDNWFAELSGKQAVAIANRRRKQCLDMLQGLEKEREQFQNWVKCIREVSGDCSEEDLVEIVEQYDDEQEKKWREQHAKNLKAYREKLAKNLECSSRERTTSNSDDVTNSEDDGIFFQRLDSLELTEEESRLESDGSLFECSDEQSEETMLKLPLKLNLNQQYMCDSKERIRQRTDSSTQEECDSEGNAKHVRWQDLSKQNIKKITFKHSKSKNIKHQDSSESEEHPLIQSPSDIYRQFGSFFQSSPPKSILKVKHSPTSEPTFHYQEDNYSKSENEAFTGQVCEHSSPVHIIEKKSSKPTSHFKNSRKNRKR